MTYEEAVKLIEANMVCSDCKRPLKVVMRRPIGGWAAYVFCVNEECGSYGPWDRITLYYTDTEEKARDLVIFFAYEFDDIQVMEHEETYEEM
jgi:hypothetical protein